MSSTVTDLQSGSLESRREGVDVLTKEQQFNTSMLRLRQNSSDLFVYNGRLVQDNFFDENLVDLDSSGAITSAPNPYNEKRTLGQSESTETSYTDMTDFDPVVYIDDEGLALYPIVLTAAGYADPIMEDGTIGVFETRSEMVGIRFLPDFAKRGAKASLCSTTETVGRKFYFVEQETLRSYTDTQERSPTYFEVGDEDTSILGTVTYQDTESSPSLPFVDSTDTSTAAAEYTSDPEISRVIANSRSGSPYLKRDKISSTAGWTFLNVSNGTDSIVYSDRM